MKTEKDRTIALAALFQATTLVQEIANKNKAISVDEEVLLYSLLQTNPSKTIDIYQNINALTLGLTHLKKYATGKKITLNTVAYALYLMQLHKALTKKPNHLDQISNDIKKIEKKLIHLPLTHESIIHTFAQSYIDNISVLGKKMSIEGNPEYLKQSQVADRIRALLLAGIRAVMLWRQCGGTKWQWFFQNRALAASCEQLLHSIER